MGIKDVRDTWLLALSHISSSTLYEDYKVGKETLSKSDVLFETDQAKKLE